MSVQHVAGLGETVAEIFYSLTGRKALRIRLVQYLIAFCSRQEVTSDVISGRFVGAVVSDFPVQFGDSRSNHSREIRPEVV